MTSSLEADGNKERWQTNMQIRSATRSDEGNIAELMYDSGPATYDFLYKIKKTSALQFIRFEYASGRGFCSYRNADLAFIGDRIAGVICAYDEKQFPWILLGTIINIFMFFGPITAWVALLRASYVGKAMRKLLRSQLYLANLGIVPELRGNGIGSALLKAQVQKAKENGYDTVTLDVADDNPRAEALYRRLGFQVENDKVTSASRKKGGIPSPIRMYLKL